MEKEFVPFELAVKLKDLGFDKKCFAVYRGKDLYANGLFSGYDTNWVLEDNSSLNGYVINQTNPHYWVAAPLWHQAFDWFRERHNLFGFVEYAMNDVPGESKYKTRFWYNISGCNEKSSSTVFRFDNTRRQHALTYDEARQACLEKLIELTTPPPTEKAVY